jgi:hypothetical protein
VDIESSNQKVLSGHDAPILSVSLHPDELLVVSMNCVLTINEAWTIAISLLQFVNLLIVC